MSSGRGTSSPAGGMGLSRIGTTTSGGGGGGQTHRTAFGEKVVGSSQDELMENIVKIGDIVILSNEECGARWNGGDSRGGRLEADGFADGGCWVREGAEGGGETFIDSLYRVKTKQMYMACKALGRALEHRAHSDAAGQEIELQAEEAQAIRRLKQEVELEEQTNKFEIQRSMGTPVHYGQVIQLEHVKSGRYLCVCPKELAEVETTCQKVSVTDKVSQDAWFVLAPRHRSVGAGDAVRYGDSVSVESPKIQGAFLHCSRYHTHDSGGEEKEDGERVEDGGCFEVNAHTERTTWKFKLFKNCTKGASVINEVVRGGDVLRLKHENSERFLSAFSSQQLGHTEALVGRTPKNKESPGEGAFGLACDKTSGQTVNGLWRIEKLVVEDGGSVMWGIPSSFRLRHLGSGRYLTLGEYEEGSSVGLSPPGVPPGPTTLLCFEEAVQGTGKGEGGAVQWNSYAMVRSAVMPAYLTVSGGLSAKGVGHPSDAFGLLRENEGHVCDIYQVRSAKTTLINYLSMLKLKKGIPNAPLPTKTKYDHKLALSVASSLDKFCSCGVEEGGDEALRKSRQALVRDIGVLQLLVDVCVGLQIRSPQQQQQQQQQQQAEEAQTHSEAKAGDKGANGESRWADNADTVATAGTTETQESADCLKVFCAMHGALQAALSDQPLSGFLIRESFEVLQKQASMGSLTSKHATKTLEMMTKDNRLLKEWLPKARLEFLMAAIDRDVQQRAHNVSLLADVVADGASGIRKNQDFVVRKWLLDKRRANLIIDTRCPDNGIVQVCIKDLEENGGARHRYVDVESFCATALVAGSKDRPLYDYYRETLRLLAALCWENDEAKHLVGGPKRHVSYKALYLCIANERIPAELRRHYTNLLRICYVSRPSVDYIQPLKTSFFFEEVVGGTDSPRGGPLILPDLPGPLFEPNPEFQAFVEVKRDCLVMLTNHSAAIVPEIEEGTIEVTVAVAKLVFELLRLGFFSDYDEILSSLLPPILSVLDGQTDLIGRERGMRLQATKIVGARVQQNNVDSSSGGKKVGDELASNNVMAGGAGGADAVITKIADEKAAKGGDGARFKKTPEVRAVCEAKEVLLHMLLHIFDLRLSARLEMMVQLCKQCMDSAGVKAEVSMQSYRPASLRVPAGGEELVEELTRLLSTKRLGDVEDILSVLTIPEGGGGGKFSQILFDLMRYHDVGLSTSALRCLMRDGTPKLELFRAISDLQLLVMPKEVSLCLEIRDHHLPLIRSMYPQTVAHLSRFDVSMGERSPNKLEKMLEAIEAINSACWAGTTAVLDFLRRSGAAQLLMDLFVHAHRRSESNRNDKPSRSAPPSKPLAHSAVGWDVEVLTACCKFIESFCHGGGVGWGSGGQYPPGQLMIYQMLPTFMKCLGRKDVWDGSLVIKAVFENNVSLLAKADEALIDDLVAGCARGGSMGCIQALALIVGGGKTGLREYTLRRICDVGPLYLAPGAEENVLLLFRGPGGKARRDDLAIKGDVDGELRYHVALLALLRGLIPAPPHGLSIAPEVFPPREIAEDIASETCPREVKVQLLCIVRDLFIGPVDGGKHHCDVVGFDEALWDMLRTLSMQLASSSASTIAAQLNMIDEGGSTTVAPPLAKPTRKTHHLMQKDGSVRGDEISRTMQNGNRPLEVSELLVEYWLPLVTLTLSDRTLVAKDPGLATTSRIVSQVMALTKHDLNGEACAAVCELWDAWIVVSKANYVPAGDPPTNECVAVAKDYEVVMGSPGSETLPVPAPMKPSLWNPTLAQIDLFSRAFVEATDPIHEDELSDDDEDEDSFTASRMELRTLISVFYDDDDEVFGDQTQYSAEQGQFKLQGAAAAAAAASASKMKFKADRSIFLVKVLSNMIDHRLERTDLKVEGGLVEWETNINIGLRILELLTLEWVRSVTEVAPPKWLVEGVPRLVVKAISLGSMGGDNLSMCALELGIASLHGGNDAVQRSYHSIMCSLQDTGVFMGNLRDRLYRGQEEANHIHDLSLRCLCDGEFIPELVALAQHEPTIHCLVLKNAHDYGSHADKVLRFLHQLCEGHNLLLQNFLRHQDGVLGTRHVDLVTAVASYASYLTTRLDPFTAHLSKTAWLALAEFTQSPCRPNQRLLVDTALPIQANVLLGIGEKDAVAAVSRSEHSKSFREVAMYRKKINDVKAAVVTTILSILESATSPYIPERLLKSLDSDSLIYNMNHLALAYNFPAFEHKALELAGAHAQQKKEALNGQVGGTSAGWGRTLSMKISSGLGIGSRKDVLRSTMKNGVGGSVEGGLGQKDGESTVSSRKLLQRNSMTPADVLAMMNQWDQGDDEDAEEAEHIAELYYITYITLMSFDQTGCLKQKMKGLWDLENLRNKIGAIEISRDGQLEKCFFIIPTVCQYLTNKTRQELIISIDRANLQTQLTDFTERFESLYEEMKHQRKLTESIILNFFRETYEWREKFFFWNALLINGLLLLFYGYKCQGRFLCGEQEELLVYGMMPGWRELVTVLACIQFLFAVSRQWWYVVERGIPRINRRIVDHAKHPPSNRLLAWMVKLPPDQSDPSFRHIQSSSKVQQTFYQSLARKAHLVRCLYLCGDLTFLGITVHTLVNILALIISHEGSKLLLTVHLLEVFNHSRVLQNVMRSVTFRGGTLLQTSGLAFVLIYFFGVFGFILFPELFQFNESDVMGGRKLEPNNNGAPCTSIWKCSLVVLDMGFRTGDVGEALDDIPWKLEDSSSPQQFRILYRMVYTLLFFIFVTTILMNIIFGVIIDTFAELRAKKDAVDRDISGRCFICGIDRFLLDQVGEAGNSGFVEHIQADHNMWEYLYFEVYLRQKDYSDYSGCESYVFAKTLDLERHPETHEILIDCDTGKELKTARPQPDILWIPQRDAMVLKKKRPTSDQLLVQRLQGLHGRTDQMAGRLFETIDKVLVATSVPSFLHTNRN